MSLAFLYNVASCIAYALVSAAYGSLYYVERRRGYLFVALIFLAYTIDIVLLFMYEFVPEFAMQFEGARNAYPMFHTAYNMVVILLYRLVLGSLLSRRFSPIEGFFWAVCMMVAWASGASSVETVALWREFLSKFLRKLISTTHTKLGVDIRYMGFHRVDGNVFLLGNLLVRRALFE